MKQHFFSRSLFMDSQVPGVSSTKHRQTLGVTLLNWMEIFQFSVIIFTLFLF